MEIRPKIEVFALLAVLVCAGSCWRSGSEGGGGDGSVDTDVDTDTDTDVDSDSDSDTDSDTDTVDTSTGPDSDTDSDTDTDSDSDSDTDTDSDTDSDTDTDVDTGVDTATCPNSTLMGDYTVSNTLQLTALSGYAIVTGHLTVEGDIETLDGLECLSQIGGDLTVWQTTSLPDVDGLTSMFYVGGDLSIGMFFAGNEILGDLDGLVHLTTLDGDLNVQMNPLLPTCAAEELEQQLIDNGWTGTSSIWGNDDLGTCD
jgi:hypothetical protein